MRVLSVGFPFAPVREDCAGGAEQVLLHLHRALRARGHRSEVLAPVSSSIGGGLIPVPDAPSEIDEESRLRQHRAVREALDAALSRGRYDLLHFHGLDCDTYMPDRSPAPVLVTLHLPVDCYAPALLRRRDLWLNAVSAHQSRTLRSDRLLGVVGNGVDLELYRPANARSKDFLYLGRICPEKGLHLAIDAVREAGGRLRVAGTVYGYPEHRRYWREHISERIGPDVDFLGPVGGRDKVELIATSRAVIVPSLVEETSSLVAMEALACGVPVVALRRGALVEIVEQGRTGWVVDRAEELGPALSRLGAIRRSDCRQAAVRRFSIDRMVDGYLMIYAEALKRGSRPAPPPPRR